MVTFDLDEDSVAIEPLGALAPSWYFGRALQSMESGHYRGNWTELEFDLPSDWSTAGTWPSETADIAVLRNARFPDAFAGVWLESHRSISKPLEDNVRDARLFCATLIPSSTTCASARMAPT
jgi:hypothetical protein